MKKTVRRALVLPVVTWAVLTVAMAVAIGAALQRMQADRIEAAFSEAEATAATAEQAILRIFELVTSIQELLRIKAGLLEYSYSTAGIALDDHLRGLARDGRFGLIQVSVVDRVGDIAWSSANTAIGMSVADGEAFRTHQAGDTHGLHIGAPQIGRVSGRWSILVSETIRRADGTPLGMGVVALDAIVLSQSLGQIVRGSGGRIVVRRRTDGTMLARSVDIERHLARLPEPDHPLVVAARQSPNGRSGYHSILSRRETISAYRSPDTLPIVISAVFDRAETLQGFRHIAYAMILAGLAVAVVGLHLALLWGHRRRLHDLLVAQAEQDPLTGLRNRRALQAQASLVLAAAARSGEPLAVLLFDLDHFKRINDTHGHDAGDTVLRDVAAAIARHVRPGDLVCRWGGEEMLVLLRHCDRAGTIARAEELRAVISGLYADGHGPVPGVTTSIGGAVFPFGGLSLAELVRTADAALYAAKRMGRNRVAIGDVPPQDLSAGPARRIAPPVGSLAG